MSGTVNACTDDIHPPTSGLLKRLSAKCVEEKRAHMWFKRVNTHVNDYIKRIIYLTDLTGKTYGYTMLFSFDNC